MRSQLSNGSLYLLAFLTGLFLSGCGKTTVVPVGEKSASFKLPSGWVEKEGARKRGDRRALWGPPKKGPQLGVYEGTEEPFRKILAALNEISSEKNLDRDTLYQLGRQAEMLHKKVMFELKRDDGEWLAEASSEAKRVRKEALKAKGFKGGNQIEYPSDFKQKVEAWTKKALQLEEESRAALHWHALTGWAPQNLETQPFDKGGLTGVQASIPMGGGSYPRSLFIFDFEPRPVIFDFHNTHLSEVQSAMPGIVDSVALDVQNKPEAPSASGNSIWSSAFRKIPNKVKPYFFGFIAYLCFILFPITSAASLAYPKSGERSFFKADRDSLTSVGAFIGKCVGGLTFLVLSILFTVNVFKTEANPGALLLFIPLFAFIGFLCFFACLFSSIGAGYALSKFRPSSRLLAFFCGGLGAVVGILAFAVIGGMGASLAQKESEERERRERNRY